MGTILVFFYSEEKTSVSIHYLNIISRSLYMEEPQIFNMRMPMLSWNKLYLDLSFESFQLCRLDENLQKISDCQSNNENVKGVCCCFFIKEHCFAKRSALKSSSFYLKSITNLFSWKNGGIRGIFYCLKNGLKETNVSQNFWALVSLLAILE